jgi:hypothetical protein
MTLAKKTTIGIAWNFAEQFLLWDRELIDLQACWQ